MRRTILFITALAFSVVCISSCDSAKKISKKTISNLVTAELSKERDLYVNAMIKTGYYEENDEDARYVLRKLAAAGIITYKADRIQKQTKYKSGYALDYSTYRIVDTYSTVTRDYIFVDVALTNQGIALTLLDVAPYDEEDDKFLMPVERGTFPEDTVKMAETFPGDAPEASRSPEESRTSSTSSRNQDEPKTDYEKAKARENVKNEFVKAYKVKVVDTRDIVVSEGKAHADYVLEAYEVTPAGRILKNVYEGRHTLGEADFIYYQDKGWVVTDNETHTYFY